MSEERNLSACASCLRRGWLIGLLGVRVECRFRDPQTLAEMLALGDQELVAAIGGRRKLELQRRYAEFDPNRLPAVPGIHSLCCHDQHHYPSDLRAAQRPLHALYLASGADRLGVALREPVVAIVGTRRPTDYGVRMAISLARDLARCGLTIACAMQDGIGRAALEGALDADGSVLAVTAGGVDIGGPASMYAFEQALRATSCVISAMPCGARAHRWCDVVRSWLLASLARMVIVVEAEEGPTELAAPRAGEAHGRLVAALPGRVTSPVSSGPHTLIREGAHLVCDAADVLDLLYGAGRWRAPAAGHDERQLEPRLREVLEQIGGGEDTLSRLLTNCRSRKRQGAREMLLALAQLELAGLLGRGDGGRYVVSGAIRTV
jgi:DNA processing protein